jgi:hypothetical protein
MEQRSLRLGDIVDDYCPRERRATNHAIVALVGNTIRQTRCSTCDSEHEYKDGKMPKKRTKGADGSDLSGGVLVTPKPAMNGEASDVEVTIEGAPATNGAVVDGPPGDPAAPATGDESGDPEPPAGPAHDAWLAHRPLIRASLPKTENDQPPPRAIPEFTMHQRQGRGFGGRGGFRHGHQSLGSNPFRGGGGSNHGQSNGNEPDGNRSPQPGGGRPGGGVGGGRRRRRRRWRPKRPSTPPRHSNK